MTAIAVSGLLQTSLQSAPKSAGWKITSGSDVYLPLICVDGANAGAETVRNMTRPQPASCLSPCVLCRQLRNLWQEVLRRDLTVAGRLDPRGQRPRRLVHLTANAADGGAIGVNHFGHPVVIERICSHPVGEFHGR